MRLTESFAMWPGASVSGIYFADPEARYFGLGCIDRDQVADYAARKHMTTEEVERWLAESQRSPPPLNRYRPAAPTRTVTGTTIGPPLPASGVVTRMVPECTPGFRKNGLAVTRKFTASCPSPPSPPAIPLHWSPPPHTVPAAPAK
jgi:hypothetical protein